MALTAVTDNGGVLDFNKVSCSYNSCTDNTVSKEMYCVCNGPDDGRMVLCENIVVVALGSILNV